MFFLHTFGLSVYAYVAVSSIKIVTKDILYMPYIDFSTQKVLFLTKNHQFCSL